MPIEAVSTPGPVGAPPVQIHLVNQRGAGRRPAILHTHGGGYAVGSAKSDLPMVQKLATALNCVIVTVEYRLAPKTTFRGSVEDNYAALRWLHGNARRLGVDAARIAVLGESAGGGHAALLAIVARCRWSSSRSSTRS